MVVDGWLEATSTSARADGVSIGSCLLDALLDACENKVSEDGLVGAITEDRADNRACKVACEMTLEEDLNLGNRFRHFFGMRGWLAETGERLIPPRWLAVEDRLGFTHVEAH